MSVTTKRDNNIALPGAGLAISGYQGITSGNGIRVAGCGEMHFHAGLLCGVLAYSPRIGYDAIF
ncbi:hypothetical protein AB8880_05135 [Alphaproteobacteria bacterium LSUCC0684]